MDKTEAPESMYQDQATKLLIDMLTVIDDIWAVDGIQVSDEDPRDNRCYHGDG